MSKQLKDIVETCTFFSLALDGSTDICDVAQLGIFIRGIDDNFNFLEELSLESLHRKTGGSDKLKKVKLCLENSQVDSSRHVSVCTDRAPSMIGHVAGLPLCLTTC